MHLAGRPRIATQKEVTVVFWRSFHFMDGKKIALRSSRENRHDDQAAQNLSQILSQTYIIYFKPGEKSPHVPVL